jgi:hypothetical protein
MEVSGNDDISEEGSMDEESIKKSRTKSGVRF